jgi:hypothetical protein
MTTFHRNRKLAERFNLEWAALAADPLTTVQLATWPPGSPAHRYGGIEAILAAAGGAGDLPDDASDHLLADLVRLAARDTLAARIVLQRLLPGLVLAAVRRTSCHPADRTTAFDDLTSTAWLVVRTYPIDRRPVRVAANLLRDIEYQTFVRPARLKVAVAEESVWAVEDREVDGVGRPAGTRHAADEVHHVMSFARSAGIPPADLALLDALFLSGRSVADVARDLKVSTRTVYSRRVAVAARMGELALA